MNECTLVMLHNILLNETCKENETYQNIDVQINPLPILSNSPYLP